MNSFLLQKPSADLPHHPYAQVAPPPQPPWTAEASHRRDSSEFYWIASRAWKRATRSSRSSSKSSCTRRLAAPPLERGRKRQIPAARGGIPAGDTCQGSTSLRVRAGGCWNTWVMHFTSLDLALGRSFIGTNFSISLASFFNSTKFCYMNVCLKRLLIA